MSIVSAVMASALRRDLLARGVQHIGIDDCEAIVARLVGCVGTIERGTRDEDETPRRCAGDEVDLDGSCMACGADQGGDCRQPR